MPLFRLGFLVLALAVSEMTPMRVSAFCVEDGRLQNGTTRNEADDCHDLAEESISQYTINWERSSFPETVYRLFVVKAEIRTFETSVLADYITLAELTVSLTDLADTKFLDSLPDSVSKVELFDNKITEIALGDFTRFKNFTWLDISYNKIQELRRNTLNGFVSLERLDLDHNNISSIQTGFFSDLENLEYLSLRHNKISSLGDGIFEFLHNIQTILLQRNQLSYIKTTVFVNVPKRLQTISLTKNPLITNRDDEHLPTTALLKNSDSNTDTFGCEKTKLVVSKKSKKIKLCY